MLGNAGSFFKNPLVAAALVAQLKGEYPDLVAYQQPDGQMKLAAGWLIERAGWKGFRDADAGVHKLQALVLVNYGGATGLQLLNLAQRIQKRHFRNVFMSIWKVEPTSIEAKLSGLISKPCTLSLCRAFLLILG